MRGRVVVEYHTKWANYGHDANTWEPLDNIFDPNLLADFERRRLAPRAEGAARSARGAEEADEARRRRSRPRTASATLVTTGESALFCIRRLSRRLQ